MSVAVIGAYSVECRRCGAPILTRARPGNTIRCKACGYAQRARAGPAGTAEVIPLVRAGGPAGWPVTWGPAELGSPAPVAVTDGAGDPVPDYCGAPLYWEPSGTLQVCLNPDCPDHDEPVFPPSLLPHERPSDPRRVATRDEILDQALALAGQREQLLGWIDERLTGARLAAGTRGHLGVFRAEIQQAGTADRLAWLASRLASLPMREAPAPPQAVRGEVIRDHAEDRDGEAPPGQLRELARQVRGALSLPAAYAGPSMPAVLRCRNCGASRDPSRPASCPCGRPSWTEWGRARAVIGPGSVA